MSAPLRLLAFGAALAAVFTLSLLGARAVRPAEAGSAATSTPPAGDHQDGGVGHAAASAAPAEPHAGGPGPAPAAAAGPVRGLSVAEGGYQLEGLTAPTGTGQDGVLAFRLAGPDGRPLTGYTTSHDQDLHLVVVRSDGTRFRHVHPAHDGQGGWSLPWRWAAAGSYRVFADFVPAATGDPVTLTSTVEVAGTLTPTPLGADSATDTDTATVAGFTVTVAGALRAGRESTLRFTVARGGQPVTTLQPYLGAAGHLVALRAGDLGYLHVHPVGGEPAAASGPDVAFAATAPTPGRYLLYLDFQVDGQVHTAAFTVTAGR